jgi:hypothetical protein
MTQAISLRELSEHVGVDVAHLKRMIRVGSLPEATRQVGPDGKGWVIPNAAVPGVIARNGWTVAGLDLTEDGMAMWFEDHDNDLWESEFRGAGAAGHGAGQLVHRPPVSAKAEHPAALSDEEVSVAEIVDSTLLDRLLGAHESRAEARARESQRALSTMATNQQRMVRELAEERYERQRTGDRLRDERTARLVADAKLAELRAQVQREMSVTEAERQARLAATRRSLQAERDAATALAAMGWLSRRRYQRRLLDGHRQQDDRLA